MYLLYSDQVLIVAGELFHGVIAFTDAGVQLDSWWLEKLCEPMEQDETVDVVYGHLEPIANTFFK